MLSSEHDERHVYIHGMGVDRASNCHCRIDESRMGCMISMVYLWMIMSDCQVP